MRNREMAPLSVLLFLPPFGCSFCDLLHFSEDCSVLSLAVLLKGLPRWSWETHSLGSGNSGRWWWERRGLGYEGLGLECSQAACYQMLNTCHLFIALIIICNHKTWILVLRHLLAVWSWAMDIIPLNFRGLTCNKGMMIILNELILYEPFRTGPGT